MSTIKIGSWWCGLALLSSVVLTGCVSQPYQGGYSYPAQGGYAPRRQPCTANQCGVVQDVRQVYLHDNSGSSTLGTIIGAIAGGVLGSTIGKGDGRTAATVIGAVGGGAVGNQVGARSGNNVAWQIIVALDNGQRAVVTQHENPQVRNGDYVIISNDHVYPR